MKPEFSLNYIPKRIVSLVPSQTELLYDLGLEDQIFGLTKFCVHPNRAKQIKEIVGGTKNIKLEKIRDLNPDIILCNKEENTKEIVEACEQICPVHVSDIFNLEDAKELIKDYGLFFNKKAESSVIIQKMDFKINDFLSYVKDKPVLKVAYFIWRDPWMVAANNTFIDYLLQLNNYENVYANKERYPEVELNKIRLEGDPGLVFLSSEPYPFKEEHTLEIERFTHHAKIVFVDGELFSWYGSRLLQSFNYFKKLRERVE
jgi:ABC-type Fe3+-hydroxamate transport system substrate-binding protein